MMAGTAEVAAAEVTTPAAAETAVALMAVGPTVGRRETPTATRETATTGTATTDDGG
jgi:hypothetical protein